MLKANKVDPISDQRPSSGLKCGKDPYSNCDGRATRCTPFATTKLLHAVRRHIQLTTVWSSRTGKTTCV